MRCMACGAEMMLMNVVLDPTLGVRGFERHTFVCPGCCDIAGRLVFTKHGRESETDPMPAHEAPSIAPPSAVNEPVEAHGLFRRALAKLRSR